MRKDEVIEIADSLNGNLNFYEWHYAFANEVERRTLERAAVVCESSPSYDWHKFACEAAAAIRALKEEV